MATKNTLRERIAEKLKSNVGVMSVWIEDSPTQVNIYVVVNNVRSETLKPILDMPFYLESIYDQVEFNVEVNSGNLEDKIKRNLVQKIF